MGGCCSSPRDRDRDRAGGQCEPAAPAHTAAMLQPMAQADAQTQQFLGQAQQQGPPAPPPPAFPLIQPASLDFSLFPADTQLLQNPEPRNSAVLMIGNQAVWLHQLELPAGLQTQQQLIPPPRPGDAAAAADAVVSLAAGMQLAVQMQLHGGAAAAPGPLVQPLPGFDAGGGAPNPISAHLCLQLEYSTNPVNKAGLSIYLTHSESPLPSMHACREWGGGAGGRMASRMQTSPKWSGYVSCTCHMHEF